MIARIGHLDEIAATRANTHPESAGIDAGRATRDHTDGHGVEEDVATECRQLWPPVASLTTPSSRPM